MVFIFFFFSVCQHVKFYNFLHPNHHSKIVNTPPHRAKLVQIPNNTTIPGHSALSAETSPQILLTSQFKFPRKTSADRSESNQAKPSSTTVPLSSYINRTSPSSPPSNYNKNDIPIHITQTYSPTHKIPKTYLKTNNTTDNSTKACLYTLFCFLEFIQYLFNGFFLL